MLRRQCVTFFGYLFSYHNSPPSPNLPPTSCHQCFFRQDLQAQNAIHDSTHMAYRFYDVACTGLAVGAYHRGSFSNAPQRLAKITCTANKRNSEEMFIAVVMFISWR